MKSLNRITSILISFLIISNIYLLMINYELFIDFSLTMGKKQALFDLYYLKYFYVVYIFGAELISLIFIFIFNNKKSIRLFSLLLVLLSSLLIFLEPWHWFI